MIEFQRVQLPHLCVVLAPLQENVCSVVVQAGPTMEGMAKYGKVRVGKDYSTYFGKFAQFAPLIQHYMLSRLNKFYKEVTNKTLFESSPFVFIATITILNYELF